MTSAVRAVLRIPYPGTGRGLIALVVALSMAALTSLALATTAHAATFGVSGTTLVYQAAPGEVNEPQVGLLAGGAYVSELGGTLTAGPGCAPLAEGGGISCPTDGISTVIVRLGDGNDEVFKPGRPPVPPSYGYRVEGGPGNDEIEGTTRNDLLIGGSGRDSLGGSGGTDKLKGGAGDDRLYGQGSLEGQAGNDFFWLVVEPFKVRSTVFGGRGNDRVMSRNGLRDVIDCGPGKRDKASVTDNMFGPDLDRVLRSCE